jgi:putative ABC transport system permease protein
VPLYGGVVRAAVQPEGQPVRVTCTTTNVSSRYFEVLGIPVTRGRTFSDAEADSGAPVAAISEELAVRFWPGIDPLGHRLTVGGLRVPLIVVGVVRDTSSTSLWREKEMAIYIPAGVADSRDLHVVARTSADPVVLAGALRDRARALDARVTFRAAPLEQLLQLWILPSRVAAIGAGLLGVLALILALVGLYGVLSYTVARRSREIGIRIALGATRADVMRLILGDAGRLIAAGAASGIAGAFIIARLLQRFLFDLGAIDPAVFVVVPLFLCAVSLAACYIPARRATRIAPLAALRSE